VRQFILALIVIIASQNSLAQVNLTQGLLAYYPFNGNANDATGNGLNGTVNNAQPTADRFGNPNSAYYFDGSSSNIIVHDNGKLSSSSFTIAYYFNTQATNIQIAIGKINYLDGNGATYNSGPYKGPPLDVSFSVLDFSSGCLVQVPATYVYTNFTPQINTNTWYCIVCTFDNGVQKIYLDGVLVATSIEPFTSSKTCTNTDFVIGSWWSGDPNYFKGTIDEVRYYNRAINPQEAAALCDVQTSTSLCTGSLGDPIVNITFGSGDNPGQPLSAIVPGASTTLAYVPVTGNPAMPTPVDGQYTITNNVPFNVDWFSGALDHTPNNVNGYMAFYNSSVQPGEFYKQTVTNLCGSSVYEFAAWIGNALNPGAALGVAPDITFRIEQTDGTLLGFYDTGPIGQSPTFTWKQYGFYFTTPPNVSSVVLRMVNNSPGGTANFGNDFALDDITFRPCGPVSQASFSINSFSDSIGMCQGLAARLYGSISSGYSNPSYLWQISMDSGKSWTNVPNSNNLQLSTIVPQTASTKDYKYRMLSGDGNNINSPNCRISSNLITLTGLTGPPVQITTDTSICPGTSVRLTATGASSYVWSPAKFLDNPDISNPVATPDTATEFFVLATGAQQCSSQDSVTISIRNRPVFTAPSDTSVCKGQPVRLNGANGNTYSYIWSPPGSLDNPTSPGPLARPDSTTQYSLQVSDPVCPYDSNFFVTVTVHPDPVVVANKLNDIDCNTPTAQLMAKGAVSYQWAPASGLDNPQLMNPTASIDSSTTFLVQGTDQNGCFAFDSVTVKVTEQGKGSFVVPNAFTPNGDGLNDCFGIKRWGNVTIEEFSVFNRWGQRVFTTRNPSLCWDGTFNGQPQDSGGYPYIIKAKTFCGEVTRKGIVLLIR
jgi:gliding motility-associated-like protein